MDHLALNEKRLDLGVMASALHPGDALEVQV